MDLGSVKATGFAPYGRAVYRYDVSGHHRRVTAFFNGFNKTYEWVSSRNGKLTGRRVRVSLFMVVL